MRIEAWIAIEINSSNAILTTIVRYIHFLGNYHPHREISVAVAVNVVIVCNTEHISKVDHIYL